MRFIETELEKERSALWNLIQKFGEMPHAIILERIARCASGDSSVIHSIAKITQIVSVVNVANKFTDRTGAIQMVISTADTDVVTPFFPEIFGKRFYVSRQWCRKSGHVDSDGRPPCHNAGAGRYALRRSNISPGKEHSLGGEFVEVRRSGIGIAISTDVWVTLVIGKNHQDVGESFCCHTKRRQPQSEE